MGTGSQSGMEGQHPAWSQMAQMGGVTSPLQMLQAREQFRDQRDQFRSLPPGQRRDALPDFRAARDQFRARRDGPHLPDPMQRAREHFLNAREQFQPVRDGFQSLQGAERAAARPEFRQDRDDFRQTRDWYRDLNEMTPGQAIGTAAMGPPRMNSGPEMAPMMEVPQFPGMPQHDGTVQGLLGILQQQTASQTFGGGGSGGGSSENGGLGPSSSFPRDERQLSDEQRDILLREQRDQLRTSRDFGGGI